MDLYSISLDCYSNATTDDKILISLASIDTFTV